MEGERYANPFGINLLYVFGQLQLLCLARGAWIRPTVYRLENKETSRYRLVEH